MISLNINFLKSQPTVGALRKVTREAQSPIKLPKVITKGDKFVEKDFDVPSISNTTPRTLNYSKLKQARTNLQVQKDFKDLGI